MYNRLKPYPFVVQPEPLRVISYAEFQTMFGQTEIAPRNEVRSHALATIEVQNESREFLIHHSRISVNQSRDAFSFNSRVEYTIAFKLANVVDDWVLTYFNGLYRNMNVGSKFNLKIEKILRSGIVYEQIEAFGCMIADIRISEEFPDICEIIINADYIHNNMYYDR